MLMLQQALLFASSSQENNLKQTLRKIPCVNDTSHGTIFAHYYTKEALDINTPTPSRRIYMMLGQIHFLKGFQNVCTL